MADRVAILEHGTTVIDVIILVLGKADQDRNAENLVTNLRDCGLDAVAQSRMEQEILRRIAANTEFGEDNKVRALLVTGPDCVVDYFCGVAGDVANFKIDLCQCNFDPAVHLAIEDCLHLRSEFSG